MNVAPPRFRKPSKDYVERYKSGAAGSPARDQAGAAANQIEKVHEALKEAIGAGRAATVRDMLTSSAEAVKAAETREAALRAELEALRAEHAETKVKAADAQWELQSATDRERLAAAVGTSC